MSDELFGKRVDQAWRKRIDRRGFLKGAAALGVSAAAITAPPVIVLARAQTKVTFWTAFTDPDLTVLKNMVTTYNGTAQGHQVELVQIPPAEVTDVTKLMTAVRGGTGPDVYHLDHFIVAQRAADKLLQDLSGYMGGTDLKSTHLAFAAAEASFDGKPYAMPFDTDARALYYRRDLLREAGVDMTSPEPIQRAYDILAGYVDRLEGFVEA